MIAAWVVNGWYLIGTAVALFIMASIEMAIMDSRIKKNYHRGIDSDTRLERELHSRHDGLRHDLHTLIGRVDDLEHPSMFSGKVENRLCPECNEEKDIRVDDYLCADCREPDEEIAA